MRMLGYALAPLLLLVVLAALASLFSYGLLLVLGDVLPIAKLISKVTLVLLLISVWPLKRYWQLSWRDLGFAPLRRFLRQLQQGLLLALLTLSPVLLALYCLDVQVWDTTHNWSPTKIAGKVALALCLSLLIGVGEELLFRGVLLSGLRRQMPLVAAIVLSAWYYALLHFLKSSSQIPYAELTLFTGWQLMLEAFANWLNPAILSALTALFVVGLFLAVIRSRVRHSLGLCIGCHAGWVWQIKICKDLFNVNQQSDYLYLVSSYDGVIGPLVSVWLLLAMLGLIAFGKR